MYGHKRSERIVKQGSLIKHSGSAGLVTGPQTSDLYLPLMLYAGFLVVMTGGGQI